MKESREELGRRALRTYESTFGEELRRETVALERQSPSLLYRFCADLFCTSSEADETVMRRPTHVVSQEAYSPAEVQFILQNKLEEMRRFVEEQREGETFHTYFNALISERCMKTSDVYRRAGMSRQLFSRYSHEGDKLPPRHIVMLLAIGLMCTADEFVKLMRTAGYAYNPAAATDATVMYCIEHELYDLEILDGFLAEQGLSSLARYCFEKNPDPED